MKHKRIYLDYHASTPVDERVLDAMLPYFREVFGNAASRSHAYGWEAEQAVQRARAEVAALVGARSPREIVFTSGATESNNLAIRGVVETAAKGALDLSSAHVITSAVEHPCVRETCLALAARGMPWTEVSVGRDGIADPREVEAVVRPETVLISVMHVNNEVGTVQPIAALAEVARRHGVLFHTDAAQAAGRVPVDVQVGVDLLSLSAHKLYGPKGVGALYVRRSPRPVRLAPQQTGGGQERGVRSGTSNVPGIVGFGRAAALAREELGVESERLGLLRDMLLSFLRRAIGDLHVHGSLEHRVPGNLNVSMGGVDGEQVLAALPHIAMSAGSACHSSRATPSHVLSAMGVTPELARGAIRIGLGRPTTEQEVRDAAEQIRAAVTKLRRTSLASMSVRT